MSKDNDKSVSASDSWPLATDYVSYLEAAVAKSKGWLQRCNMKGTTHRNTKEVNGMK